MSQVNVGAGDLIFQPPNGAIDAAAGVVSTPIRVATLQEVTLDYSATVKEIYGEAGFAKEMAVAERKLTGKAKFAKISGRLLAMCLDGAVLSTGTSNIEQIETGSPSAGSLTVSKSANFQANLGVYDSNGNELKEVASAPTVGQYSVVAGVYTHNTGDNGKTFTYRYSYSQTQGNKVALTNPTMGIPTKFKLFLYNYYVPNGSKTLAAELPAVVVPKLSMPFKNTDFTMPDLEFNVLDDGAGNIGTFYIDTL